MKIGVLAKRGAEQTVRKWQPTADYLGRMIPQRTFVVVPLSFDQVRDAVAEGQVDFLLVNSAIYVEMEHDFQVSRIATMKNLHDGKGYSSFGGVIFNRADQPIDQVEQLRGKTFMAVDPTSFGGAIVAWRELQAHDFDPFDDFRSVTFGKTHDAVVFAVRDGLVDVGTVRTDTLERMADEGKIALDDFHVMDLIPKPDENVDFPFLRSTRLYPEWPMAKLKHVPEELAKQVAIALLGLEASHPAAQAGQVSGWTIPQNYQSIHDCLKLLHLGPYRYPPKVTFGELFAQYRLAILGILALLVVTTCSMTYFRMLGRRLQQSELKVREAHAELDQLFQASADGIFRVDTEFNIVRVNRTFEEMSGFSAKNVIGHKCYEIFPGSECGTPGCPIQGLFSGENQMINESLKRIKDGSEIPCLVFAVPFRGPEGAIIGIVEYIRDISALKKAEADLQQSRDALNEAYQELQRSQSQMLQREKMATVGQLAAGMAHEINNPLGFIGSNLGTLNKYWGKACEFMEFQGQLLTGLATGEAVDALLQKRKQLKIDLILEDTKNLIEESLDGVDRVKIIVANLKGFSRVDQAKYDQVDINQCLDATLSIIWNELKYNVTLHKDYGELPLTYCYPQQLNQVFLNLLVNAGHAIEGQGDIHIGTRCENGHILVTIRDTGCGIPEENLSRLFEPFFTTKEVGKGTGLGLSIVYDIIKNHNGKIRVKSHVGEGTTFAIKLPVVDSAPQAV
ncbi:MAG: PhnD/SsuA/transferrin family substrate-binding protein [Desulfuromonadaceae bacterium]